jgi:hypothetical protein
VGLVEMRRWLMSHWGWLCTRATPATKLAARSPQARLPGLKHQPERAWHTGYVNGRTLDCRRQQQFPTLAQVQPAHTASPNSSKVNAGMSFR